MAWKNPNGYGTVIKLGGNRRRPYAARVTVGWTVDGRQRTKYIGYFEERTDAMYALAAWNAAPHNDDARMSTTLAEAYAAWSERKLAKASEATRKYHKSAFAKLEPLHNRPIATLRTDTMQTLLDSMESDYSASMLRNVRRLLVYSFKWAMERDIVDRNYAEFTTVEKSAESDLHYPFSDTEVCRVMELADAGDEAARMCAVLLFTGLRINEMLTLRTDNIDLDARIMVGGSKTKAGKNRRIPVHRRIDPFIRERMGTPWLFMGERKVTCMNRTVFMAKYWTPLMKRLGIEHTPHDTRGTFVSRLDTLGANEVAVKMIVGHGFGGDVTKKAYTFKTDAELIEAVDMLDW